MYSETTLNNGTAFFNIPFDFASEKGTIGSFYVEETIETGCMPTGDLPTRENDILFDDPLSMGLVEKINLFNPFVSNDSQNSPSVTSEALDDFLSVSSQDNAQEVLEQNSCISNKENTPAVSKKRKRKHSSKETSYVSKLPKTDSVSIEYMKNYREAQRNYNKYLEKRVDDLFKTFIDMWEQIKAKYQNSLQPFDQDVLQKFKELRKSLRPLNFSSWKKKNNVLSFPVSKSNSKRSTFYREIHEKYDNYKISLINKLFIKINEGHALLGWPKLIEEPVISFSDYRQFNDNNDYPTNQENQRYILKRKRKIIAIAYLMSDNRMCVMKDSKARMSEAKSLKNGYSELRQQLVEGGILIPDDKSPISEEKLYIFTTNYTFKSATSAAVAILGRTVSGKNLWKNESGQSITKVESNKWV